MEGSVLPALRAGRPLTQEHIDGLNTQWINNCADLADLTSAK